MFKKTEMRFVLLITLSHMSLYEKDGQNVSYKEHNKIALFTFVSFLYDINLGV
jgi:hypothetical protein